MLARCARSVSVVGLALTACSAATEYPCETNAQCVDAGVVGVCQSPGWCSFPDDGCESGQRYGDLAGSGLAGTCVPVDDGSTGVADDDSATATATTPPTTDQTTTDPSASSTLSTTTPLTTGVDVTGEDDTTISSSATTSTGDEDAATTDDGTTGSPPICATYVDDFEDGVIGPDWDVYLSDYVSEVGGARVFLVSADESDNYPWTGLVEAQDLTQGWVRARVGMPPTSYPEHLFLSVAHVSAPNDLLLWFLEDVYLIARFHAADEPWIDILDTTYDPDLHRWLQIRGEDTTVYFEVAGDDLMFETLATYDAGFVLDEMVVAIHAGNYDPLDGDAELSFEHLEVCSP